MERLFIDTAAWYAVEVSNDLYHPAATQFSRIAGRMYRWTTTNWIIWETVSLLRKRAGHAAAVEFREHLQRTRLVDVITVSMEHEVRAWELFKRYQDKDFGFVDCTSFAVMRALEVNTAFTFDEHFRQAGFRILPDVKTALHEIAGVYETERESPSGSQTD
jgi:uncharacterized protein